jgi:hypothetical protein
VTLLQLIHALFWELSFFGTPKECDGHLATQIEDHRAWFSWRQRFSVETCLGKPSRRSPGEPDVNHIVGSRSTTTPGLE